MKKILVTLLFSAVLVSPAGLLSREITLSDVVSLTLKNNYDIQIFDMEKQINEFNVDFLKAVYDGVLTFKSGYSIDKSEQSITQIFGSDTRTLNFDLGFSKQFSSGTGLNLGFGNTRETTNATFVTMNPLYDASFEISLSQPLLKNFGGLQYRAGVDSAAATVDILNLGVQEKAEVTLFNAMSLYWDIYLAQEDLKVKRESLGKAEKLVDIAKKKLLSGLAEKGDLYAFEALRSVRESDAIKAERYLYDLDGAMKLALSVRDGDLFVASQGPDVKKPDGGSDSHLAEAMSSRRDYLSAKKDSELKDIELKMYGNSRYPRLDLLASLKSNGISGEYENAIADVPKYSHPAVFFGIEMDLNLNNREARGNYSVARLKKQQSLVNLKKTEEAVIQDVLAAIRRLNTSVADVEKSTEAKKFSELKLSEEEKRYSQGRSKSETIVNYEGDLLNARLSLIHALVEYEKALVGLNYAKNTLLSRYLK